MYVTSISSNTKNLRLPYVLDTPSVTTMSARGEDRVRVAIVFSFQNVAMLLRRWARLKKMILYVTCFKHEIDYSFLCIDFISKHQICDSFEGFVMKD